MAREFDPSIGKNTQFSSTNQPANNGRKKKVFTWLKETYHLPQSDLENIINYMSMLSKKEFEDLQDRIKNNIDGYEETPMLVVKIMQAYEKADINDIIKMMRATGKANDTVDVNANISGLDEQLERFKKLAANKLEDLRNE